MLAIGSAVAWTVLLLGTTAVAAFARDRTVRLCAFGAAAGWVLTLIVARREGDWIEQTGLFAIDLAVFGLLLTVGLRSDRLWPLVAAGFQLIGVALHVATLLMPADEPIALKVGLQVTSYGVQLTLLWAAVQAFRRRHVQPERAA